MKKISFCLFYIIVAAFCEVTFAQQQSAGGDELIVGYYGRPNVSSLGVLGQYSIEELAPLIKPKMMTPTQVLGMESVSNSKFKIPPRYINYQ